MTKTRPFLSTCYGYPSTTEVPPCCQAATKKLTFSTTSVLLLLNVPLSLSRGTVFRRPKNPRRGYRPIIAGILFVCNEPEGKYYTVPCSDIYHNYSVIFSVFLATKNMMPSAAWHKLQFYVTFNYFHANTCGEPHILPHTQLTSTHPITHPVVQTNPS